MKNNKIKLQYIEWQDAITMSKGWYSQQDLIDWGKLEESVIKQVGYLIEENKKYILLASKFNPQESEEDKFAEITKIPTTWIRKRVNVSVS